MAHILPCSIHILHHKVPWKWIYDPAGRKYTSYDFYGYFHIFQLQNMKISWEIAGSAMEGGGGGVLSIIYIVNNG